MGKRLKRDISIYTLPTEVLEVIFLYLGRPGLIQLSTTCKTYRRELTPYVFDKVKTIWHNFEVEGFEGFLNDKCQWTRQLRIIDTYSYGEWQLDIFTKALNRLPYLDTFIINTYNSTNWFKYRQNPTIKSIKLYYDFNHNETELLYQNPNPKKINRLSRSSNLPKIFNLNHLNNFKSLTNLSLDEFHFNWDEAENINFLHLKRLTLVNCTWEYPFTPIKFNENNSLISLQLYYTNDNAFILSERFSKFLAQPLQSHCKVEKLAIGFRNCKIQRYLSTNQFMIFIGEHNFPHLVELDLTGWVIDDKLIRGYLETLDLHHIHQMKIRIGKRGYYIEKGRAK